MSLSINAVTSPASIDRPDAPKPFAAQATASTKTVDTATISNAAMQAAKAAQQEATETPAQTAKEARTGDVQAQHLLAREAAARG